MVRRLGWLLSAWMVMVGGSHLTRAEEHPFTGLPRIHAALSNVVRDHYLARAQVYRKQKDEHSAIAAYTEAIRLDSRCTEAYLRRASCYLMKKVTGKAIADYTAALRIDPDLDCARIGRAMAYLWRSEGSRGLIDLEMVLEHHADDEEAWYTRCLIYLFQFQDHDRVLADAGERIRRAPGEPRWYLLRCMTHLSKGEFLKAAIDAAIAACLDPSAIQFRLRPHSLTVGIASTSASNFIFSGEDDSQERIDACTNRLQRDPDNVAAYYERACAYQSKRAYKPALSDFDQIVRLDPSDAEAFRNRGTLFCELGAHDKALEDYEQAMRLDPENADTYVGRARPYAAMKNVAQASQDCDLALYLDPFLWRSYELRGWICCQIGEYDKAIANYSAAIRLCPGNSALYRGRVAARGNKGDCAGVIADYKEIVKREPASVTERARLSWCLSTCPDARLRNGSEARKLALEACRIASWHNAEALTCLAAACAQCGDFDAAVKWQTRAGELLPDSAQAFSQHCLQLYREHKTQYDAIPRPASPPASAPGVMRGYSGRGY